MYTGTSYVFIIFSENMFFKPGIKNYLSTSSILTLKLSVVVLLFLIYIHVSTGNTLLSRFLTQIEVDPL